MIPNLNKYLFTTRTLYVDTMYKELHFKIQ